MAHLLVPAALQGFLACYMRTVAPTSRLTQFQHRTAGIGR